MHRLKPVAHVVPRSIWSRTRTRTSALPSSILQPPPSILQPPLPIPHPMHQKLQTMINAAEAISTEVESLLAEPTQENLLKAQDLNAKFKGLADDIELFRRAESDALAAKEFLSQPIRDVPFETGVSVIGMRPAGAAEFAHEKGAAALFNDGEGLVDERQWRAISEPGYKAAFRSYLRKGEKGLTGRELKALQEGADASGGFLVPEDFVQRLLQKEPTPTRVQDHVMRM